MPKQAGGVNALLSIMRLFPHPAGREPKKLAAHATADQIAGICPFVLFGIE